MFRCFQVKRPGEVDSQTDPKMSWRLIQEAVLIGDLFLAGFKPGEANCIGQGVHIDQRGLHLPLCIEESATRLD